jgi:hypothetical protein
VSRRYSKGRRTQGQKGLPGNERYILHGGVENFYGTTRGQQRPIDSITGHLRHEMQFTYLRKVKSGGCVREVIEGVFLEFNKETLAMKIGDTWYGVTDLYSGECLTCKDD